MTGASGPATTVRSERGERPKPKARVGLEVGVGVGRYVVLGVAGQGGFGAVYRAYDPELDRKVALKVLDERADDDPALKGVVLAEARSLAKLRHPNIVTVYDVGEHDGRGFVAMEYVEGRDLAGWLDAEERPWAAIAAVMAKAARGLAAAHAAGIVHRDFKPSNVLVDDAGEAYVADFGLARTMRHESGVLAVDHDTEPQWPPGTPPYLAPELYDGADATPQSDVFAYCVALWKAAYGALPWDDEDEATLLEAKRAGVPTAPKRADLPASVATIMRRGLAADPEARPASPEAIADALTGQGGRRVLGVTVLGGLAALAAVVIGLRGDEPCAEVGASVEAVWNEDVRGEVTRLIVDGEGGHADEVAGRLVANVDRWVERWLDERNDACEATHVRREQSPALLDRRMTCLDRELAQIVTVLELVRAGDPEVVRRSPRAVAKLSRGLACDAASLGSGGQHPSGPEAAAVIADLDRAEVLEVVAQYDAGLELATQLAQRAEALGATGLKLRAQHRRGRLLDLTGDGKAAVAVHEQVHWDAEAEGWDDVAANAGLDVMYEYAAVLGKPEVALSWAPHVRAAIRRAGDDARRRATLIDATGIAHLYSNEVEAARDDHEEALQLRRSYDESGLDTVATLQNLGIAYEELHRYDDAVAMHEQARAILVRLVGEHHPHTARVVDNLGTALLRKGDVEAARQHFRTALEVRRSVLAPGHRSIALSTMHLGHASLSGDDPAGAIEQFQEALRLYSAIVEPGSRDMLICHEALAHAYKATGDDVAASKHASAALDGLGDMLPDDHPEIVGLRAILEAPP